MKHRVLIGLIATLILLGLTAYFWPASHIVGNFDPRADENSEGQCP
jgi:ABC-type phosphate transport system auxiliary subunit